MQKRCLNCLSSLREREAQKAADAATTNVPDPAPAKDVAASSNNGPPARKSKQPAKQGSITDTFKPKRGRKPKRRKPNVPDGKQAKKAKKAKTAKAARRGAAAIGSAGRGAAARRGAASTDIVVTDGAAAGGAAGTYVAGTDIAGTDVAATDIAGTDISGTDVSATNVVATDATAIGAAARAAAAGSAAARSAGVRSVAGTDAATGAAASDECGAAGSPSKRGGYTNWKSPENFSALKEALENHRLPQVGRKDSIFLSKLVPDSTLRSALKRVGYKPITLDNVFPLKKNALLSNQQVEFLQDVIVKRDQTNNGIDRKECIEIIAELGRVGKTKTAENHLDYLIREGRLVRQGVQKC